MAAGISRGDEVIIPGLTFVSDANTVMQLGAKPVLADSVSLANLNVSFESIERKRYQNEQRPSLLCILRSYPMDLSELIIICREKNILLIEDCAHAPGAQIDGLYLWCTCRCFIFFFF